MDFDLLLKGAAIGLAIAAPVGPIGVLCIRRTLAEGRLAGFVSGLGAATADAIYSCIAGFSLTFLSSILIHTQAWLHLIGGLFLCYLGIITFLAKDRFSMVAVDKQNLRHNYHRLWSEGSLNLLIGNFNNCFECINAYPIGKNRMLD